LEVTSFADDPTIQSGRLVFSGLNRYDGILRLDMPYFVFEVSCRMPGII
jgi:hypothetical protein